jgi:hypothetical protein
MKTTFNTLATILTISAVALASTTASAGGGGKKGGGGFSIGFGGGGQGVGYHDDNFGVYLGGSNHHHGNYNNNYNQGSCHTGGGYGGGYGYGGVYYNVGAYNSYGQPFGQAFEPFHCTYICQPGDNFYTVSLKEYATSANQAYIASFNNLPLNVALLPGQRLVLPSISANGQLSPSRRPLADGDVTPVAGIPANPVTQNFTTGVTNLASTLQASTVKPIEEALPKVAVGSTLVLDGQVFGEERGVARLRVSGLALPVEVLEWTNTSAKVRLPLVEITSATKADIEVLRADGSVAAKTGVELNPAANRLAQGN